MREQHLLVALEHAQEITACRGDTLFEAAESQDSLYYLLSGEILLKHQQGGDRIITGDFHWLPIVQFQAEDFSAKAITDCEILRFDRLVLDNLLTWSQVADYLEVDISYDRDLDEDADWLRSVLDSNLFYKIPPLNILSIYSKVSARNVVTDDVILEQGQEGDFCYFIKEGLAEVVRIPKAGEEAIPVAQIGEGRCFGEDALIQNTTRNATVKMLTDGIVMCLHKNDFKDLLVPPSVNNMEFETIDSMIKTMKGSEFEFLDVRTQEEFDYKHIINAIHIPLTLLRLKIRLLDPNKHYLVYCNTGTRSRAAAFLLARKGYKVSLLAGGLASISLQHVKNNLVSEFDSIYQMASSDY
ncbi:MAG: CRP-like cAMP-binding protein/rhodanese-related sulfurtransferase [Cellvibrionaceae bacterium]|jgi:CRP-like cAMP-binding protein/rhodanese-related sulfurtransferase